VSFDPEGLGFVVNLINETITFDGGYTVKIAEMLDYRGEYTDDLEAIEFISFVSPPDGLSISIRLDLLDRDEVVPVLH